MTDRSPSPSPSPSTPTIAPESGFEGGFVATTPQLAAQIEQSLGYRPDRETLEDVLLELDRGGYVEWVTVTRAGDYVWDLSESPDRIADAVAEAAVERLSSWLEGTAGDS